LPTGGVDGLERLGLVAVEGGRARATCDLRPYADEENGWWLASDLSEAATNAPLARDHVLGIGGASTTLASWTPRPVVATALDLGTGCGVQSVHLASHAGSVTATDLSSRALGFAQFNAALNGSTWELLRGSLLEPVAGRRFDLVVSNPPFVITPRVAEVPLYEYRDGGAAGDAFVQGLVLSLADHLEPGGIAQLLGNWEIGAAAPSWRDRVDQWLDGTGLDAWVVQRDQQDPAQYAETWARDGGHQPGTDAFDTMYTAWLADFAARGVVAIGFGVVTLQRPETPREPWRDLMEVTGPVASPMGPAVLAGVRARTWLAEHDDEAVLSTAWRCAEDVTEERHGRPGDADPSVILLRQGGGLRRAIRLDTVMAALVSVCDGELTAGQALAAIASLMGADTEQVRGQALPVIRELVADGLLVR
jgi:methylase of polypeptide subunit release factors